jgi:hypothetical protein
MMIYLLVSKLITSCVWTNYRFFVVNFSYSTTYIIHQHQLKTIIIIINNIMLHIAVDNAESSCNHCVILPLFGD